MDIGVDVKPGTDHSLGGLESSVALSFLASVWVVASETSFSAAFMCRRPPEAVGDSVRGVSG